MEPTQGLYTICTKSTICIIGKYDETQSTRRPSNRDSSATKVESEVAQWYNSVLGWSRPLQSINIVYKREPTNGESCNSELYDEVFVWITGSTQSRVSHAMNKWNWKHWTIAARLPTDKLRCYGAWAKMVTDRWNMRWVKKSALQTTPKTLLPINRHHLLNILSQSSLCISSPNYTTWIRSDPIPSNSENCFSCVWVRLARA